MNNSKSAIVIDTNFTKDWSGEHFSSARFSSLFVIALQIRVFHRVNFKCLNVKILSQSLDRVSLQIFTRECENGQCFVNNFVALSMLFLMLLIVFQHTKFLHFLFQGFVIELIFIMQSEYPRTKHKLRRLAKEFCLLLEDKSDVHRAQITTDVETRMLKCANRHVADQSSRLCIVKRASHLLVCFSSFAGVSWVWFNTQTFS